ncbi:MAG: hypothetical protein ACR2NR_23130 [Solirubrobacteraceae bacterium]
MSNPQISLELMRSRRRELDAVASRAAAPASARSVARAPVAGVRHVLASKLPAVRAATQLRSWVR